MKHQSKADLDVEKGTVKRNCLACKKARSWLFITPAAGFRLLAGERSQEKYQRTLPGRPARVQYHFCKKCGIRTPARGEMEELGGTVYAVQVNLLDDLDPDELARAPIAYVDGLHDRFNRQPDDIRFL